MHVREHAGKVLHSPNTLGTARSEDFGKWIDRDGTDADVVHRDARIVGLLDGMRRVGPSVAALVDANDARVRSREV